MGLSCHTQSKSSTQRLYESNRTSDHFLIRNELKKNPTYFLKVCKLLEGRDLEASVGLLSQAGDKLLESMDYSIIGPAHSWSDVVTSVS
jgi:hypothetical protein